MSRRSFLQRTGALIGAGALAGLGVAESAEGRRPARDLSARRARTYTALVGTVALAQGRRADASYAERACAEFRAWYRGALPHIRASVDATLDSLDRRVAGGFAHLGHDRRKRALRSTGAPAITAQAVALASPPFCSYEDDGLRSSPGAI